MDPDPAEQLALVRYNSSLMNIDQLKIRQLEKIDLEERNFWEGWDRYYRTKTKKRHATSDFKKGTNNESSIERIKSAGDPRFIEGVLRCIKQRAEILGLEAVRLHKADINLNTLPDQQLDFIHYLGPSV